MRQKMVVIGDDFWIENEQGQKVYKVDGKALRVRQTLIFEDAHGNELAKIQERMLRIKDSMETMMGAVHWHVLLQGLQDQTHLERMANHEI